MDDQGRPVHSERATDWRWLGLLLLLALPIRGWLLFNTEVTARDSIGFIRYALDFENRPWGDVIRSYHQHPGYPMAIYLTSLPVRAIAGTDPTTLRVSAQLASTIAALLLLVPMYYLGKELWGRQVGFWGALLFQYLPVSGHHLSDGISEAVFLLFIASALWQGVVAIRRDSLSRFALAGCFGGLAYLTRPEGALVVFAVGMALVLMQFSIQARRPWRRFLASGLSLSLAAAAVGSIYVAITGQITNKPAANFILGVDERSASRESDLRAHQFNRPPLMASILGIFFPRAETLPGRVVQSLRALALELSHGLHYVGWVAVFAGLWFQVARLRREPIFLAPLVYCIVHALILFLLGMKESYVSDRHTLPIILLATYWIPVGVREVALRINPVRRPEAWASALLIALVVLCLPKTSDRLHANREGNRAAGYWLGQTVARGDCVEDDHAWSHFYAGMIFREKDRPALPRGYQPTCYWVITRSKDVAVSKQRQAKEESLLAQGRLVYHWPEFRAPEQARVTVYALPRDFAKQPWDVID